MVKVHGHKRLSALFCRKHIDRWFAIKDHLVQKML